MQKKWSKNKKAEDAWQVLRIQGEFIKGFDQLSEIGPCISIFGSARTSELNKHYKLGRVRLLLKEPRSTLSWHRDPEPRLHIPIITNPGCLMVIDKTAQHMPADGGVWVTNNVKYHNAFNGGEENRVHLVACVLDYNFN